MKPPISGSSFAKGLSHAMHLQCKAYHCSFITPCDVNLEQGMPTQECSAMQSLKSPTGMWVTKLAPQALGAESYSALSLCTSTVNPLNSTVLPSDCSCMCPKAQASRSTFNIDCEYETATAINNAKIERH